MHFLFITERKMYSDNFYIKGIIKHTQLKRLFYIVHKRDNNPFTIIIKSVLR